MRLSKCVVGLGQNKHRQTQGEESEMCRLFHCRCRLASLSGLPEFSFNEQNGQKAQYLVRTPALNLNFSSLLCIHPSQTTPLPSNTKSSIYTTLH